ncbi:MAG: YbaN family protein [Crocinitomicaceae bacterium]
MKYFWIGLGFLAVGLGVLGIALPYSPLPHFFYWPYFCFSKGSEKFHKWFVATKMYKDYIESYRPGRPIKRSKKIEILTSVFIVLALSFYFVDSIALKIMLTSIFVGHIIYFSFIIKTEK